MLDPKGRPKKVQRCQRATGATATPCPCPTYDLTTFEWREHGTVVEVWKAG